MNPASFMLIAGEPSGDRLAAGLVREIRAQLAGEAFAPRCFGAGGPRMAEAGVELDLHLTAHAVTGVVEVARKLAEFRRLLRRLLDLACARQPDVIVCVDFSGFNRRFAHALRQRLARQRRLFHNWRPRLVQYVSPQVWASRPGRADALARDFDLLLCLFEFEKDWYARRVRHLRVEWVGHPLLDELAEAQPAAPPPVEITGASREPEALLLPGSRRGEVARHLPVMLEAARLMAAKRPVRFRLVAAEENLRAQSEAILRASGLDMPVQVGGLTEALRRASVALASTGTVTLECALAGVPTVAMYITAPVTFWIAKRIATVRFAAMPNLLAGREVFPEFLQGAATPGNLARAALAFLDDPVLRARTQDELHAIAAKLGEPGASRRAAAAVIRLLLDSR